MSFARSWGFGGVIVVNLFALRSTDPAALYCTSDPVGPANDESIHRFAATSQRIVVAWGTHGSFMDRDRCVLAMLDDPLCLGVTLGGQPRHPLYVPGATPLVRFSNRNRFAVPVRRRGALATAT